MRSDRRRVPARGGSRTGEADHLSLDGTWDAPRSRSLRGQPLPRNAVRRCFGARVDDRSYTTEITFMARPLAVTAILTALVGFSVSWLAFSQTRPAAPATAPDVATAT